MLNKQFLSILLLGCILSGTVYGQDVDVEIIETNINENVTTNPAAVTPINELDEAKCGKKRKGCCEQLYLGNEESLAKCFTLHQTKIPNENEKNPSKLFKFMSCFVECLYKQKKFLGKGDNINMKMVKLDAQKTYENRPKERDYQIKLLDFCRKDALNMYNLIKFNPAGRVLLKDGCKPYYMFVFLCEVEYHRKHECPYFRWEGKRKTSYEESCREAKEKCYEIDGITLD